jgi:hypothetical protein
MNPRLVLALSTALLAVSGTGPAASAPAFRTCAAPDCIQTAANPNKPGAFDLARTEIRPEGNDLVFHHRLLGIAGSQKPAATGQLGGAWVQAYVWPTSLDSGAVGFESGQGILALAVTAHPDFDDTPKADENGDGKPDNDGAEWHAHWVVLGPDEACGAGGLKVRDIPEGTRPRLPATWPELPLLIDSPAYTLSLDGPELEVRVPAASLGAARSFRFDGVTAELRVNPETRAPLLCVTQVHDVASGNLSLPGTAALP